MTRQQVGQLENPDQQLFKLRSQLRSVTVERDAIQVELQETPIVDLDTHTQ